MNTKKPASFLKQAREIIKMKSLLYFNYFVAGLFDGFSHIII